jgi:hypothetical protein
MPWQCFQWKMHIKVRFGRTRNGLGWWKIWNSFHLIAAIFSHTH